LPVAQLHLGLIAERGGRADEARKRLAAAIPSLSGADRTDAHRALARLSLGRVRRAAGRAEDAKAAFEKARRASKDDTAALLELASLARQTGDAEGEKTLY